MEKKFDEKKQEEKKNNVLRENEVISGEFGRYLVEKEIGLGSYSHVYLGRRLEDNKHVAIKVLSQFSNGEWKD